MPNQRNTHHDADQDEKSEEVEGKDSFDELTTCPECEGNIEPGNQRGEKFCEDCGLIVEEESVDRGPEWRAFNEKEKDEKSRVGAPTTNMMHDHGLSTNIGWQNKDAYGNQLSSAQREKMERLRTWNERFRTRSSKERNLKQALGEVDRMASALGLPDDVRETAAVIYRRALDEDLLPGRSIEGVATASLYAAARQSGSPRSLSEVSQVSRVEEQEFKRAYRYLVRELKLEMKPVDPKQYVNRIVSDLEMTESVGRRARQLLDSGQRANVHSGKSPVALAAAAIYAAGLLENEKVTQADISTAANVSEVTIRNRYRELLEAADKTE